jgi:hypothetical protein
MKTYGAGKDHPGKALKTFSVWVKFDDGSNYRFDFLGENEMQDFASVVGESIDEEHQTQLEKKARIAKLSAHHLAGITEHPVDTHAKNKQTSYSQRDRPTRYREEAQRFRTERRREPEEQEKIRQVRQELGARLMRLDETKRGNAMIRDQASASSSFRGLMPSFSGVATVLTNILYSASAEPKREKSEPPSPNGENKKTPRRSQMAEVVGLASRTPSDHAQMKSEPASRTQSVRSGMVIAQ